MTKGIVQILWRQNRWLSIWGRLPPLYRFLVTFLSHNCLSVIACFITRSYTHSQTRGSIPIHWTQTPSLKYKPKPRVASNDANQLSGIQKHFDEQITLYGQQTAIDLINQSGSEKSLGDAFKHFINTLSSMLIRYFLLIYSIPNFNLFFFLLILLFVDIMHLIFTRSVVK